MTYDEREEMQKRFHDWVIRERHHLRVLNDLGVPVVPYEQEVENTSPYIVNVVAGKLESREGPIEIHHGDNYYWIVHGPTPLAIALKLYAHPVGRHDVRVAGHCGCPPPEAPWVRWRLPSGRPILDLRNHDECQKFLGSDSDLMRETATRIIERSDFSDEPWKVGAQGYVDSYHIDSDEGLRLYVETLRKEGWVK